MEASENIAREGSGNNFVGHLHWTNQRNIMDNSDGDGNTDAWMHKYGRMRGVMLGYDTKSYNIISIED